MPYLTCLAASNKGKKENKEKVFLTSLIIIVVIIPTPALKNSGGGSRRKPGNRGGRGYLPGMLFWSSLKVAEAAWLWRVHPGGGFMVEAVGLAVALVV
jgi:hypothetical protein